MNDGDALLKAIITCPDDDSARLVYADWLDEHDQPERAEFIRVQMEVVKLSEPDEITIIPIDGRPVCKACIRVRGGSGLCRYHELHQRSDALKSAHADDWVPRVNAIWNWRRGFVESVQLTASDWLDHADDLRASHPIAVVELVSWPTTNELAACFPRLGSHIPVRLSDIPPPEHVGRFLEMCWPGVSFLMPSFEAAFFEGFLERQLRGRWKLPEHLAATEDAPDALTYAVRVAQHNALLQAVKRRGEKAIKALFQPPTG